LERRLWGLQENESVEFVVPVAEAFGYHDPDLTQTFSRKRFPPDVALTPGQQVLPSVLAFPPEHTLTIKEVNDDLVVLDLNHPLVDQDLYYSIRVVEVRDATPEELEPRKQCKSCRDETGG
jgi:FKBP-type peptidyl-prolyl cis-trans isomerase SlyD